MLEHLPKREFDCNGVHVVRHYNTNSDVFGGKPYLDEYDESLSFKSKSEKEAVMRYMDTVPKKL